MTRVNFQEYGVTGKKSGICPKCGRRAVRSAKFFQTQNPFNRNKQGDVKSVDEIMEENRQRLFRWKEEPVYHEKCED
jgi:hypothetical protein